MIHFGAIAGASAAREPFPHLIANGVVDADALSEINRDFPAIRQPGIFPLSELTYGGAFASLVENIKSAELEAILEDKFGVKLSDKPLMVTVRGYCRSKDGRIHNDSKDKLVTCLLYLNDGTWAKEGGRLRLLRDDHDLDNMIAEVAPEGGNFVAFKRTENSWHGHASYEGPRRYVMFNWLTSGAALAKNLGRHRLSAAFKRLGFLSANY
jgi:SM-20-related protein